MSSSNADLEGSHALTVAGLSHSFGRTLVLDDVSFALDAGLHAVVGSNGSGKTTLLRAVATAVIPPAGSVFVDGCDVHDRGGRREARRGMSFLPQSTRTDSRLKVADWLEWGAWLQDVGGNESRRLVADAVARWDLGDLLGVRMRKLSVGQRRRVDLARACLKPDLRVLVLDEPFAALDARAAAKCRDVLTQFAERTVVLFADPDIGWTNASVAVDLSGAVRAR